MTVIAANDMINAKIFNIYKNEENFENLFKK